MGRWLSRVKSEQMVEYSLVVPLVKRNLIVVIISVSRLVIQVAVGTVNYYHPVLRHAVVGKLDWRRNATVV